MKKALLIILLIPFFSYAEEANDKNDNDDSNKTLKLGNLSLRTSQQPGPLVSFGQNIIDKGQTQLFLYGDYSRGGSGYSSDVFPSLLYQMTDELSIFINTPFTPRNKSGHKRSAGLEDFFVQFEYAYAYREERRFIEQATVVGSIIFPTGSVDKNPTTGFGSFSVFLGATFSHTAVDWLYFASPGVTITTSRHGTKMGDQLFYQFGFGRLIAAPPGWIFSWLVEIDGQYNWKSKTHGKTDHSSGGNSIYITPSLWFSNNKLIIQVGAGCPISHGLIGFSTKDSYMLVANLGWTLD